MLSASRAATLESCAIDRTAPYRSPGRVREATHILSALLGRTSLGSEQPSATHAVHTGSAGDSILDAGIVFGLFYSMHGG